MRWRACLKHVLRVMAPRENDGVAAVEFAILSTIFLTLLAGTIDIGLMLYTDFQLDSAVDSGAQYALNNAAMVGSNPATLSSNVSSIVNNLNGSREGLNKGAAGRYRLLTLQQPVRVRGLAALLLVWHLRRAQPLVAKPGRLHHIAAQ